MVLQLQRDGFHVNHKTVKRLMKKMDLYGITPRAKYRSYRGNFNETVSNRLLHPKVDEEDHTIVYVRDFNTERSNQIWATDVSEFHIAAGKLYLSPILDLYDHTIISYNISSSADFKQTVDMLEQAFAGHTKFDALILHSDQGWQYQMKQYRAILKEHGIIQSMSRKGHCLDNCVMENFFGKMKTEMFYGHEYEFKSLEELKAAMEEYITYYNTERIQVRLKGLTPCEARNQALKSR
ncbi:MAG: IS3 family transposase [Catenisphaera adipataccumulans]|uniref:IS3 family transposase n=1 Tax=Catenisphaera adipataccumulans TaxID=700500 RepID=UPI003D8D3355